MVDLVELWSIDHDLAYLINSPIPELSQEFLVFDGSAFFCISTVVVGMYSPTSTRMTKKY